MFSIDSTADVTTALYQPQHRDNIQVCISTSTNGTTHVWNIASGDVLCSLQRNRTRKNAIAYMKEQQYLICAQIDRPCLNIYDLRKEEPIYSCSVSEKITCLDTFGNFCFGGSESGAIYVWNVLSGELIRRSEAHLRSVECIAIENGIIVTGGSDTLVNIWNIAEYVQTFNESINLMTACSIFVMILTANCLQLIH